MWLFIILVLVPIVEISLFIQVGGFIGLWPTLAIVILTALMGSALLRRQGFAALQGLQQSMSQLQDPTQHLFDGAMVLFSGALLLTPGFMTDTIGLLLLLPPVRAYIFKRIKSRISVVNAGRPVQSPAGDVSGTTIEGEYTVVNDKPE